MLNRREYRIWRKRGSRLSVLLGGESGIGDGLIGRYCLGGMTAMYILADGPSSPLVCGVLTHPSPEGAAVYKSMFTEDFPFRFASVL